MHVSFDLVAVVVTLLTVVGASAPAGLDLALTSASIGERAPDTKQQSDEWHAPDLFDMDAEGVTAPVLVRDAKPNYTSAALQARIQGFVRMDCIVELDGTIRSVRIRHSLDPSLGLDAEAVRTVREWLFKPGLKGGVPVRTRISIEMSFLLGAGEKFNVDWPEDLRPKDAKAKVPDQFRKETLTAENLQISLMYPPDWRLLKDGQQGALITVERTSEREASGCTLSKLEPVKMDVMVPMTDSALKAYAKQIKDQLAADADIELSKVGQIGARGRTWIWSEMSRRRPDLSRLAPETAASFSARFEGMRIWQFTTTDSWRQLSVICNVFVPRGATKDSLKQTVRSAGEDFAAIIRGITIRPQ